MLVGCQADLCKPVEIPRLNVLLLRQLLAVVPLGEVPMDRIARGIGAIVCAAVTYVAVEAEHSAGRAGAVHLHKHDRLDPQSAQ